VNRRIEVKDLDWSAFYKTHPDSNFFNELINVDCDYLEDYYNEFLGRSKAISVTGDGLYAYEWELLTSQYILENSYTTETHTIVYIPNNILPIIHEIAFKYKSEVFAVSESSNIQVIDDYKDDEPTFSLKIPISYLHIMSNSIVYSNENLPGIWFPSCYKDANYIEDHFGKILNVFIDRTKYYDYSLCSMSNQTEVLSPAARIQTIHIEYASMIKELILIMLTGHPSPSNIASMVDNILTRYSINPNISCTVKDRVNDLWGELDSRYKFIIEHNGFDDKAEDVVARMVNYFKPVFAWALIKRSEYYNADNNDICFDDISMYNGNDIETISYDSVTLMQASLPTDMGSNISGMFSSFDDKTEIKYVSQYKE